VVYDPAGRSFPVVADSKDYADMIGRIGGPDAVAQWRRLERAMAPLQQGAALFPAAAIRSAAAAVAAAAVVVVGSPGWHLMQHIYGRMCMHSKRGSSLAGRREHPADVAEGWTGLVLVEWRRACSDMEAAPAY
jgi:hypothetical protein